DKDHDLALLRIYGARGLKPLSLTDGAGKSGVELTGIADPQNQGGGAVASTVKASIAQVGSGNDLALSPAPLVPADTVHEFLKANGVNAAGGSSDAKAAVVRVICVRK